MFSVNGYNDVRDLFSWNKSRMQAIFIISSNLLYIILVFSNIF